MNDNGNGNGDAHGFIVAKFCEKSRGLINLIIGILLVRLREMEIKQNSPIISTAYYKSNESTTGTVAIQLLTIVLQRINLEDAEAGSHEKR